MLRCVAKTALAFVLLFPPRSILHAEDQPKPASNDVKVAMWGGSYAGFDQWSVAKEFPPHLATIVPAAAAHPGVDFPFRYNIFGPYDMQWLTFTSGRTGNEKTFGNHPFWSAKTREVYKAHSSFDTYDALIGKPSPIFQKWLQHPTPDAYYDAMAPSPEQYQKLAVPQDNPSYLTNQAGVINLFGEAVVYHSEPFDAPSEVSGFVKLTLWLQMDMPDTDLDADLYEIRGDGISIQLTSASMRARYRDSLREEKLVPAGKAEKCVFDNFTFFSRRMAKGSRLRLVVHSLNSPSVEKNYNSGGMVAEETGKDARTAHILLLHDADHPSTLELAIVK